MESERRVEQLKAVQAEALELLIMVMRLRNIA
jgi:hypothetical protein